MRDEDGAIGSVRQLAALRETLVAAENSIPHRIRVCTGPGCRARGADAVYGALVAEVEAAGTALLVEPVHCEEDACAAWVAETGCAGACSFGPQIRILPEDISYFGVTPSDVPDVVRRTILQGEVISSLLFREPGKAPKSRPTRREALPIYSGQQRTALSGCGAIPPESIDAYIAAGGFAALAGAIESGPERILDEVTRSGLRGRGGGGFSTGEKWRRCAARAPGEEAYVICNGDEGDPAAYGDVALMEGDPFRILEGMIVCAVAVGAREGILYVRNEYGRAVSRLQRAVGACRDRGILGERVMGSDVAFDIRIVRGIDGFVCGESSALIGCLEGRVGEPRAKYVHTVERGLFGKPTVINNVETFACVPAVMQRGAAAFGQVGTAAAPGTKVVTLAGRVRRPGLAEVPLGTPLRDIVFDVGGGTTGSRPLKAVYVGGPSGGAVPAAGMDIGFDFESLTAAGATMGSGGIIVLDDRACMVDVAKGFVRFLMEESCGKCVPCREGLFHLHRLLDGVSKGRGREGDSARMAHIATTMRDAALCGLGKTAANPVLSTLRAFREEYEIHIRERRCPAGVCPDLTSYTINETNCDGCGACLPPCPSGAISGESGRPHRVDERLCIRCGACREACPRDAVETSGA